MPPHAASVASADAAVSVVVEDDDVDGDDIDDKLCTMTAFKLCRIWADWEDDDCSVIDGITLVMNMWRWRVSDSSGDGLRIWMAVLVGWLVVLEVAVEEGAAAEADAAVAVVIPMGRAIACECLSH